MSVSNDTTIVAIALLIAVTYGTFLFMYSSDPYTEYTSDMPAQNYTEPSSGGFFGQVENIGKLTTSEPSIFFVNTIIFGTIAFLLVMVGLRFLRGQ